VQRSCADVSKMKSDYDKLQEQQTSELATSSSAISSKKNFDIQDKFAVLQTSCNNAHSLCVLHLEK